MGGGREGGGWHSQVLVLMTKSGSLKSQYSAPNTILQVMHYPVPSLVLLLKVACWAAKRRRCMGSKGKGQVIAQVKYVFWLGEKGQSGPAQVRVRWT